MCQQDYMWWYGWAPMVQKQAKVQSLAVDLHRLKAIEDKIGIKANLWFRSRPRYSLWPSTSTG
jgi:hypothetical protein